MYALAARGRLPVPRLATVHRRRSTGFSLVELAMVLAIISLMIAAIMLFFATATDKLKAKDTIEERTAIFAALATMYGGQPDYTGATSAVLAGSKLLPAKWTTGGGTGLTNPFQGTVDVYYDPSDPPDGRIEVVFYGISQPACVQISTTPYGDNNGGIAVAAGSASAGAEPYGHLGVPLTLAEATAACSGPSNEIRWSAQ
jgi:prepilin-type N-terminal cleavage/methylation domain-containing protein